MSSASAVISGLDWTKEGIILDFHGDETFTDVNIVCKGQDNHERLSSVRCHATVLGAHSTMAAAAWKNTAAGCRCAEPLTLFLPDAPAAAVKALLTLLYTGEVHLATEEEMEAVREVAAMLGIGLPDKDGNRVLEASTQREEEEDNVANLMEATMTEGGGAVVLPGVDGGAANGKRSRRGSSSSQRGKRRKSSSAFDTRESLNYIPQAEVPLTADEEETRGLTGKCPTCGSQISHGKFADHLAIHHHSHNLLDFFTATGQCNLCGLRVAVGSAQRVKAARHAGVYHEKLWDVLAPAEKIFLDCERKDEATNNSEASADIMASFIAGVGLVTVSLRRSTRISIESIGLG